MHYPCRLIRTHRELLSAASNLPKNQPATCCSYTAAGTSAAAPPTHPRLAMRHRPTAPHLPTIHVCSVPAVPAPVPPASSLPTTHRCLLCRACHPSYHLLRALACTAYFPLLTPQCHPPPLDYLRTSYWPPLLYLTALPTYLTAASPRAICHPRLHTLPPPSEADLHMCHLLLTARGPLLATSSPFAEYYCYLVCTAHNPPTATSYMCLPTASTSLRRAYHLAAVHRLPLI